jgi:hypothetical protein
VEGGPTLFELLCDARPNTIDKLVARYAEEAFRQQRDEHVLRRVVHDFAPGGPYNLPPPITLPAPLSTPRAAPRETHEHGLVRPNLARPHQPAPQSTQSNLSTERPQPSTGGTFLIGVLLSFGGTSDRTCCSACATISPSVAAHVGP